MISCVLLSAGNNQRFGSPKALAIFNERPLIAHIQDTLIRSKVAEIIIVLGASCDEIQRHVLKHPKIKAVFNQDYSLGQTSSFKSGVKKISSLSSGIILLPVDCPFLKSETIDLLIGSFLFHRPQILIPTYSNLKGHPPIFNTNLKTELLALENSVGVNCIAQKISTGVMLLPVNDSAVISTFNTPEEFEKIKTQFPTT